MGNGSYNFLLQPHSGGQEVHKRRVGPLYHLTQTTTSGLQIFYAARAFRSSDITKISALTLMRKHKEISYFLVVNFV